MNNTEDNIEFPLAASFPLPFRVLCLVGLGILGWATNLHGLDMLGVDVITTMDLWMDGRLPRSPFSAYRLHKHGLNTAALYRPVYRIFGSYSALCFMSWIAYRSMTHRDALLADEFGYVPGIAALSAFLILICPFNVFLKTERFKFLHATGRCLFPSREGPIHFSDVVFADIMTSFAKVLGDVWLSMWMLLPGNGILNPALGDGWLQWVLPTIMSLPYLARLRQCLAEYRQSGSTNRRPLYNALKYATSFPVIYLSAAQRIVVTELATETEDHSADEVWRGKHHLFRLWLLAAAVNSLYSYWWDVTNDWGLDLLKPNYEEEPRERPVSPRRPILPDLHSSTPLITRDSFDSSVESSRPAVLLDSSSRQLKTYPYGLRPTLLYPLPVYPLLLFLNLVLRLTWSIKLSSHLHLKTDGSVDIFWLEIAEVARRWMWVFLRVEWEVVKKAPDGYMDARTEEFGDETGYEMIPATPDGDLFGLLT